MKKEKESQAPSNMNSADDLIVKVEQEKLGKVMPDVPIKEEIKEEKEVLEAVEPTEAKSEVLEEKEQDKSQETEEEGKSTEEAEQEDSESKSNDVSSDDSNETDEYGTKIGKKKLYSEEEVQKMIRERLKRGQHQSDQQVTQKEVENFKPDESSEESWETQLEGFIEKTIEKRARVQSENEWRRHEEQSMAEFEVKFSEGMGKYKDFNSVVGGKPITNAMMLATRSMKDPAAFLYAACKQQPKELERISSIKDTMAQAAEIGRLEERMKKARTIPSSPKPASRISGDASSEMPQLSIDARIAQHAKSKIMR